MILDLATLIGCGIGPTQARIFLAPLTEELRLWGLDTPLRAAMFIAQAAHESARFTHMEEDLYYRDPERTARLFRTAFDKDHDGAISPAEIEAALPYMRNPKALANRAYADRMGNGPEASGDGWAYRGRGLGGLTGRDNYFHCGTGTGRPYEEMPELVALPPDACKSFAWFFVVNRCGAAADSGDVDAVTRRINPGMAGLKERRALYFEAARAFHLPP